MGLAGAPQYAICRLFNMQTDRQTDIHTIHVSSVFWLFFQANLILIIILIDPVQPRMSAQKSGRKTFNTIKIKSHDRICTTSVLHICTIHRIYSPHLYTSPQLYRICSPHLYTSVHRICSSYHHICHHRVNAYRIYNRNHCNATTFMYHRIVNYTYHTLTNIDVRQQNLCLCKIHRVTR